ncbi:MAG TPA: hypothetical protein VFI25_13010 [Planctomycetota bacterium]|nr:hypothetical protein [Planctomycetota bacterium]
MIAAFAIALLQSRPASAPAPAEGPWLTDLGERILSRCDLVILARVAESVDLGGGSAAMLHVERRLDGGPAPPRVSVLAPRGSLPESERSDLFFLQGKEGTERFGLVGRVAASDPTFAAKTLLAEETLRIAALRSPEERLQRTRLLLHRGLAGEDPYLRANALLEFERWAERFPRRLGKEDVERIRALAGRSKDAPLRKRLERLCRTPGKEGGM